MQCEVVIFVIFAEHGEAVLDHEVVGGFLGDAELEHVSVFLTGHPCLIDHHGHPHWVLAFLLLFLLPLVLGQSLDVDIMGAGFSLAPHKHLHIEFCHSLLEGHLPEIRPPCMLLQLRELDTPPHPARLRDHQQGHQKEDSFPRHHINYQPHPRQARLIPKTNPNPSHWLLLALGAKKYSLIDIIPIIIL